MTTYEVRPYQEGQDESFDTIWTCQMQTKMITSQGWDEQMSLEEELKSHG